MTSHVVHRAMSVLVEPGLQVTFGLSQVDVADANLLKTEIEAPLQDIGLQLLDVVFEVGGFVGQCIVLGHVTV